MNTVIVGAGLAGLAAAHELNKAREKFLLFEKTDSVGGKLTTIQKEINSQNYSLDLGFQVIPSAYPSLQEIISPDSFTKLNPCYFDSGAILLRDGKSYSIGDPFQDASSLFDALWNTLLNPLLSLEDKIRTLILRQELGKYSLHDILGVKSWQEQSALAFLQERRFSDLFLNNFAKPFFCGVFGDNSLGIRASNFAFTLKAFSQGKVFIPAAGIQRLPELIAESLPKESIKLQTTATSIKAEENGKKLKVFLGSDKYVLADAVILAVEPETLIEILGLTDLTETIKELIEDLGSENSFRVKYHNLYFTSSISLNTGKKIFLNCNPGALINNGVQISEIQKNRSICEEGQEHLISVTVLNSKVESKNLPQTCIDELETLFPQTKGQIEFLESFEIKEKNSLFQQTPVNYERIGKLREAIMAKLPPNVFLAGEFMSENCSQEMSIQSGLQSARLILGK